SPVSYRTSFSLAPPRALTPPLLFTSSIASSAPICSRMPWRAHGPDSGTTSALFTSLGFCARARRGASAVAAPASPILIAVRRPNGVSVLMPIISRVVAIPWWLLLRLRQAQVRASNAVVAEQRLVRPLENDVSCFEHVAMIRTLQRL